MSIGLIVTELLINAVKHAFPDERSGKIQVSYAATGSGWRLSVSDDGVGRASRDGEISSTGLGTSIVEALAHQLDARVEISRACKARSCRSSVTPIASHSISK